MYIKLRTDVGGILYLDSIPNSIDSYRTYKTEFWYFKKGALFSYTDMNYKFKSRENVESLLDELIMLESEGTILVDLDQLIDKLEIQLLP